MNRLIERMSFCLFFLVCIALAVPQSFAAARHPNVASLDKNSREIFQSAMLWGDRSWDAQTALCHAPETPRLMSANPHAHDTSMAEYFMVRESSVYALGLLLRDGPGDRGRAAKTLDAILKQQFRNPGKRWDGTFRRSPNEADPDEHSAMWRGYDPNWREFIGTTFAVILNEFPEKLPADLNKRLIESIDYAIAGEIHEGRLKPSYTNIALMYGYLWNFAAEKGGKPEWKAQAEAWQEEVYRLYKEHDAFNEYNSPTYCGTDLFGLALWRVYGSTPRTRAMGSEMEEGLWRASGDFYNANLRNLAGPYDRSYGMNMQNYVSVMGLWMRMVTDADKAPLVGLNTQPVDHVADLWFIPEMVILDAKVPADVLQRIHGFTGEREVRRPIEAGRIATAWIGKTLIYGGEITGHTRGVDIASQFHPVTAQWLTPNGSIGWLKITSCPFIDADATRKGIDISTEPGEVGFRIDAPGVKAADALSGEWKLAGLTVKIDTDAKEFTVVAGEGYIDVSYKTVTRLNLRFTQTSR